MILPAVALALALFQLGQQASASPSTPESSATAESRRSIMLRDANAAAVLGISQAIANAPKKGVVLPRQLYMPDLADLYPAAALRAEQQGLARLKCRLTVEGRLEACALETSSGFALLDTAAFEVAKIARYTPRIVDRVPETKEALLPVRWVIE